MIFIHVKFQLKYVHGANYCINPVSDSNNDSISIDGIQYTDDAEDNNTDDNNFVETTSSQTGYNYPVPDNPLTLPPRRTTTPKYIGNIDLNRNHLEA